MDNFIERKITTGFIVSTEYVQQLYSTWDSKLLEADTARVLIGWCLEYFERYHRSPGKDIEGIYAQHLRQGLDKERAEWIEMILAGLSEEYERQQFNVSYLLDQTKSYLRERRLKMLAEDIQFELSQGRVEEAEALAQGYLPIAVEQSSIINPFSAEVRSKIKQAFAEREAPLIRFPKALGKFWNRELVRGGFVALMGMEKIGKTFNLIELSMRAMRSGCNVMFFQAGDMTELQFLRRLGVYLARRSDDPEYCEAMWVPTVDCLLNQLDECNEPMRESNRRLFQEPEEITWQALINAARKHPEHVPCHNCPKLRGTPWLKWQEATQPLTWTQAYRLHRLFEKKTQNHFRLSTHANEILSVAQMKAHLDLLERREGFVPDVVVVDYADILAPDPDFSRLEFRHQQNRIWQRLRNLSEERHCLVLTATQIKVKGYDKKLLTMSDFSEDKRKFAHVTAMYGMNQTPEEKQIGLLRLNALVVREADFNPMRPVTVLNRIQMGRPFLGSYK